MAETATKPNEKHPLKPLDKAKHNETGSYQCTGDLSTEKRLEEKNRGKWVKD
ncbi:MAG: hypothetical protein U9N45_06325 [Gemmatimonadota bacterium]|nr:hypothetical protein [Gemmatimonadota bacterium]